MTSSAAGDSVVEPHWVKYVPQSLVRSITAANFFSLAFWSSKRCTCCVACTNEGVLYEINAAREIRRQADIGVKDASRILALARDSPDGWVYIVVSPTEGVFIVEGVSLVVIDKYPNAHTAMVTLSKKTGCHKLKLQYRDGSSNFVDPHVTLDSVVVSGTAASDPLISTLEGIQGGLQRTLIDVEEEDDMIKSFASVLGGDSAPMTEESQVTIVGLEDDCPISPGKLSELRVLPLNVMNTWSFRIAESWILCAEICVCTTTAVSQIRSFLMSSDCKHLIYTSNTLKWDGSLPHLEECRGVVTRDMLLLTVKVDLPDPGRITLFWEASYVMEEMHHTLLLDHFYLDNSLPHVEKMNSMYPSDRFRKYFLSLAAWSTKGILDIALNCDSPKVDVEDLMKNLELEMHLQAEGKETVFYKPTSDAGGWILVTMTEETKFFIFAKNQSQLNLFVRMLTALLPADVKACLSEHATESDDELKRTIAKEIYVVDQGLKKVKEVLNQKAINEYRKFRAQLAAIELETDKALSFTKESAFHGRN